MLKPKKIGELSLCLGETELIGVSFCIGMVASVALCMLCAKGGGEITGGGVSVLYSGEMDAALSTLAKVSGGQ